MLDFRVSQLEDQQRETIARQREFEMGLVRVEGSLAVIGKDVSEIKDQAASAVTVAEANRSQNSRANRQTVYAIAGGVVTVILTVLGTHFLK